MEHMANYGLSYGTTDEFMFRQNIFNKTDVELKLINSDPDNTYIVGHNAFSVMTDDEFAKMKGFKHQFQTDGGDEDLSFEGLGAKDSPINWVEKGMVTPVKN